MTALIELEVIFDGEAEPQLEQLDLENGNHCFALVVSFGNQIYEEVRATAHTVDAAIIFASLLRGGGFTRCDQLAQARESRLGKPEDICLNASSPYVWLSSTTTSGDRFELPEASEPIQEQSLTVAENHVADQHSADIKPVILSSPPNEKKKAWWEFWK